MMESPQRMRRCNISPSIIDHRSCRTAAATLGPGLFFVKNRHCRCLSRCPSAPIAILPVWLCLARAVLLRSLPAHGLQWIASSKLHIRNISHVLDDFLLLTRDKAGGQAHLSAFLPMCADIGIPIAPDKTVQLTQVITFLGLEFDSVAMEVRLPVDKLNRCTGLIETCLKKDKIQLKPLQSIIGTLNFACGAVVPGRPF